MTIRPADSVIWLAQPPSNDSFRRVTSRTSTANVGSNTTNRLCGRRTTLVCSVYRLSGTDSRKLQLSGTAGWGVSPEGRLRQDRRLRGSRWPTCGADRIYTDEGLLGRSPRPGLRIAFAACRKGDVLVVAGPHRLDRSVPDACDILTELAANQITVDVAGTVYDLYDRTGPPLVEALDLVANFEAELARTASERGRLAPGRRAGCAAGSPN